MTLKKYENIKKTSSGENKWYSHKMIETFSSIIGFTPSILDSEKKVSRTLNSHYWNLIILIKLIKMRVDFIICYLLNKFILKNSVHLLNLLDKNELE